MQMIHHVSEVPLAFVATGRLILLQHKSLFPKDTEELGVERSFPDNALVYGAMNFRARGGSPSKVLRLLLPSLLIARTSPQDMSGTLHTGPF